jgi:hypothetical protein
MPKKVNRHGMHPQNKCPRLKECSTVSSAEIYSRREGQVVVYRNMNMSQKVPIFIRSILIRKETLRELILLLYSNDFTTEFVGIWAYAISTTARS